MMKILFLVVSVVNFTYHPESPVERGYVAVFQAKPYRGVAITWGESESLNNKDRYAQLEVWGPKVNFYYPDR